MAFKLYSASNPVDQTSGAIITVDSDHHEIHDGKAFVAQFSRTTAATNGHRSGLYIRTPTVANGNQIHLIAAFATTAAAIYSLCEGVTIASNVGTHTGVIYNRNRLSAVTSVIRNNATTPDANKFTTLDETQIAADGTFNVGTVLQTAPISTGTGPFPPGGLARGEAEFVLKADTKYVFLVTNTSATATTHWILLTWYESTPEF